MCRGVVPVYFFLLLAISDLRFSSAMSLTVGSADVSSCTVLTLGGAGRVRREKAGLGARRIGEGREG